LESIADRGVLNIKVLEKTMGVGGAVGLSTAANIFIGMVEAPLVIKPYLRVMSRGELFIVMTCGMAGIAGTVMVLTPVCSARWCRMQWATYFQRRLSVRPPPSSSRR
jgi:hypothetical protein